MKNLVVIILLFLIGCSKSETEEILPTVDYLDYPIINEFLTAGVVNGIPINLKLINTVQSNGNIQEAIDDTYSKGGGVVLLKAGTYQILKTINIKSNVVLRGENTNTVILESTIRSTWDEGKKATIQFTNVSNAGVENLTFFYKVDGENPIDRTTTTDGGWCGDCFQNNPNGREDLYVRQIVIDAKSNNNWVQGCKILNSGTDPIQVLGNHNTFQNNFIDRCYNKGGDGNGYYDIRGDYNLFKNEKVKRIRHFAIQLGASYNVVYKCDIEVDVNFHNGDDGNNLLEQNKIVVPTWHGWDIFGTGGAQYGHKPPGKNNLMVNNETYYRSEGPRYNESNKIYTFTDYGAPTLTDLKMPVGNTFYPIN